MAHTKSKMDKAAEEAGFRMWFGSGGAEHYGMTVKEGPAKLRGKYLMLTAEDDTLSRPHDEHSAVLLSVFRRPVLDDGTAQDPLSEHVYPNMDAALNAVISLIYS